MVLGIGLSSLRAATSGDAGAPAMKRPFPRVQVVPLPDDRASFQFDGVEKLCYHYPSRYIRPYWFPLIGPAGRAVTRISHPRDPNSHSHHKSIWVAHNSVNGNDFWSDRTPTRIVHDQVIRYGDGPDSASMVVQNFWLDGAGKRLLKEIRGFRLQPLADGELIVDIELEFTPVAGPVTFGKTSFGFLAVRVAKTMGVNDGGGVIRNSEGAVGEKNVFWKPARWVDYSGPIAPDAENGITLMDHPSNPRHPTFFHVRSDGWMGTSFCCEQEYVLAEKQSLKLRHRLYVHKGRPSVEDIDVAWKRFARE
jgi:hypothetical protein